MIAELDGEPVAFMMTLPDINQVLLKSDGKLLPFGWLLIKTARNVLRVPRHVLMPIILVFCVVGAYAINNATVDIGVMLGFGVLAYLMEAHGFPIAPTILGVVLGGMFEQNFVTSLTGLTGGMGARATKP